MRYLVTIPVPTPWYELLSRLQDQLQLSSWHQTIGPHITVLAPDQPLLPPEPAVQAFLQAPLPLPTFTIRSRKLEVFNHAITSTLVLTLGPQTTLDRLLRLLLRHTTWQATKTSRKRSYTPHITIANGIPRPHITQILQQATDLIPTVEFSCDTIQLHHKSASWPQWQRLATRQFSQPKKKTTS